MKLRAGSMMFRELTLRNSVYSAGFDFEMLRKTGDWDRVPHYNIYYAINPDFILPQVNFNQDNGREIFEDWLRANYRRVVGIRVNTKEDAYAFMQGNVWSPEGEARGLIEDLGLKHTSMSVGDVIEDTDGNFYFVDICGFKSIDGFCEGGEPDDKRERIDALQEAADKIAQAVDILETVAGDVNTKAYLIEPLRGMGDGSGNPYDLSIAKLIVEIEKGEK